MALRAVFKQICDTVSRYREDQEIRNLEGVKRLAESGYGYVAARGGAVIIPISAETAKKNIEHCEKALTEIAKKRDAAFRP